MTTKKNIECRVKGKGRVHCFGATRLVVLQQVKNSCDQTSSERLSRPVSNVTEIGAGELIPQEIPEEVTLCQRHHQELSDRGILNFFRLYDQNLVEWLDDELPEERHMTYLDPGVLEGVANARKPMEASGGYGCVPGFEELRQTNIVLEELALTDKQLTAVCLVFYGGVKKKHAARAMKISAQALSDHIKAALKKIKGKFFQ